MATLKQRLITYLETISGEHLDLQPIQASALPLFLRERYAVYVTRLFGRRLLLAFAAEDWEGGSPGEYRKHLDIMQKNLGKGLVVVLPVLPSHARNRMVQMGIPFVVPGNQAFLPDSVIDLREHFPRPNPRNRDRLSPAAQCTVLYHLLRTPLQGVALKEISQKVGYSQMMLTKVKGEWEAAGICKTIRSGRSLVLEFSARGRELWNLVLPYLGSPVRKTCWIQWQKPERSARLAGLSALSRLTAIADDRLPTHALTQSAFQDFLERGICSVCPDADQANAKMEIWAYPPERLGESETVDPLSLYLSLRNSADERVQQQLEQLIEGIKW